MNGERVKLQLGDWKVTNEPPVDVVDGGGGGGGGGGGQELALLEGLNRLTDQVDGQQIQLKDVKAGLKKILKWLFALFPRLLAGAGQADWSPVVAAEVGEELCSVDQQGSRWLEDVLEFEQQQQQQQLQRAARRGRRKPRRSPPPAPPPSPA